MTTLGKAQERALDVQSRGRLSHPLPILPPWHGCRHPVPWVLQHVVCKSFPFKHQKVSFGAQFYSLTAIANICSSLFRVQVLFRLCPWIIFWKIFFWVSESIQERLDELSSDECLQGWRLWSEPTAAGSGEPSRVMKYSRSWWWWKLSPKTDRALHQKSTNCAREKDELYTSAREHQRPELFILLATVNC